ncbi:hypothetical protein Ddye_015573 [Dipteronia dyeriana]|uniref:Uncharacterized protein n=1 Tax=Dipteronia dyeriana TaxID=168575 RepID=A0AAD9U5Q5_9ROSI|nr:hypothetical protein Ddye_015573 [Dipteronia dyeriana]
MLQYRWSVDDLAVVCGFQPVESRPWHEADVFGFHDSRKPEEQKFERWNRPIGVSLVSCTIVLQHDRSGNCGARTLQLMEYLPSDQVEYDWKEADMGIIREKMTVEVFCNSMPQYRL